MGRRKVRRKQEMKGEAGDSIASDFGGRSGMVLCPQNEESSKDQSPLAECVCVSARACVGNVESGEVLSALILP